MIINLNYLLLNEKENDKMMVYEMCINKLFMNYSNLFTP